MAEQIDDGVHRTIQVVKSDMVDLTEALAWIIGVVDGELNEAENIRIQLEQFHHEDCTAHLDYDVGWNAVVIGTTFGG